ncbi:MAG: hypothetical protein JWP91_55 [Fibrobacteres bacterium]|nr:hypothetical protein [Fibrobacterota bacterium]
MAKSQDNRNTGLNLIQGGGNGREFLLEKMRGKLAGSPLPDFHAVEKRRYATSRSFQGWGWKAGLAAVLFLSNAVYLAGKPSSAAAVTAAKRAPTLVRAPAALGVNEQALFWAYSLYDFNRLKADFGVPKTAIVDARLADMRLRELLPKADAPTRARIERYRTPGGGRTR